MAAVSRASAGAAPSEAIPSEAVLPLAGFLVGQGTLGLPSALLISTAGSLLGAWPHSPTLRPAAWARAITVSIIQRTATEVSRPPL